MKIHAFTTALGRQIKVKCYSDNWLSGVYHRRGGRAQIRTICEYDMGMLDYICDEIKRAQRLDDDRVILITGDEGSGKSTLAAHLFTKLGGNSLDHVAFSGEELKRILLNSEDGNVIWYDEGARGMYRREWMTKFQRYLVKAFTLIRVKRLVSIICLPHKGLLDAPMERRISYWGHVVRKGYERGWVEWMVPKRTKWNLEVFWLGYFVNRFPKFYEANGFKWEEYLKRKRAALEEELLQEVETEKGLVEDSVRRAVISLFEAGKSLKEISQALNLEPKRVEKILVESDWASAV